MTTAPPRMVGLKTAAAVALTALLIALGGTRHALDPSMLSHLSPAACFLAGLVSCLAVALLGVGWRFGVRSTSAVALVGGRPAFVERLADGARPRELPGMAQRVLLLVGFASVAIAGIGNHAAARILQLPEELAEPAPSEYCLPEPEKPAADAPREEPAQPVEQPGCALVMRAYKLGYAKTLGSCAPRKPVAVATPAPVVKGEPCTRRQLDEPYLHYGFRRVAEAASAAVASDPFAAAGHRMTEVRAHVDHVDGLLANMRHAITGSPHAAHHLWVNLPDPHPGSPVEWFVGEERCSQRFADLPLWPAWRPGDEARLVEHVLGHLLFATRFGTTASCSDYVIHWDAPADTCRRLASEPIAVLERDGATRSVRAVLDRRRRQLEVGALAQVLGRPPPAAPPGAAAIASLSCLIFEPAGASAGAPTGTTVAIDGDAISLRELHAAAVRVTGDGPIDVYAALALLLGGRGGDLAAALRQPEPVEPAGEDFLLTRLDPLVDADPFRGARAPLQRPELVEVYPFEHHLHGFVDGFRRRYLSQRGRL